MQQVARHRAAAVGASPAPSPTAAEPGRPHVAGM